MPEREIDSGHDYINYQEATALVNSGILPLQAQTVPLAEACGRIAAARINALTDSPSAPVSLKDGFAVSSEDVKGASSDNPARLTLAGDAFAGVPFEGRMAAGEAVRICSGACLPEGADAVVPDELCRYDADAGVVLAQADAGPGRNILAKGADVRKGMTIVRSGELLQPGMIGLLAAGGLGEVEVFAQPRVTVLAIGSEIVVPGAPLSTGEVHASNLAALEAWLKSYGLPVETSLVGDEELAIESELLARLESSDVVVTSGGAWGSSRDLILSVLERNGWRKTFHRVRMGPGKGVAFGTCRGVPVFCLPGGPPSNEMAFLQFALPGILRRAGLAADPFPMMQARLKAPLHARGAGWRQILRGRLVQTSEGYFLAEVAPRKESRLESMARGLCLIHLDGERAYLAGDTVSVQLLGLLGSVATNGPPAADMTAPGAS